MFYQFEVGCEMYTLYVFLFLNKENSESLWDRFICAYDLVVFPFYTFKEETPFIISPYKKNVYVYKQAHICFSF